MMSKYSEVLGSFLERIEVTFLSATIPPVDLHWFFEISIRTEKKFQLELKKKFSYKLTEKNFQ